LGVGLPLVVGVLANGRVAMGPDGGVFCVVMGCVAMGFGAGARGATAGRDGAGAGDVADGADAFADGADAFADGADAFADGADAFADGADILRSPGGASVTFVGTLSPSPAASPAGFAVVPAAAGRAVGRLAVRVAGRGAGTWRGGSPSGCSAVSGLSSTDFPGALTAGIPITVERALRMTRPFDHNSSVWHP
jgi:hypothetical protein